ncbi:PREDICTED: uncharacterized protein LOC109235830 [Nicotiana attenuata]|uniref:uncharacterized protein LOC109235830 n=1 Tax=Nicotiana attenuata TaxID=49451 RepID=UPI0009053872|nr:PREDICTED: uncharacterized protein LOC109235830 [Nicotiana attenuata]
MPGIICEHCGYKGHLKENCFKRIGYPADFKSKRKNQTGGEKVYTNNVNVNNEEGKAPAIQLQGNGQFFTEDQYKQLVKLLSKPATLECSTNMTGIISLLANVGMCDWVIDTGATHDVTYSKDILSSVRKIEDQERNEVQLPTGNKAQITHTREASVLGNKTDLYSGKVMGIGREHNGLYLLKENITVAAAGFFMNKGAAGELWHLRLEHASLKSMQHIPELKNKVDMQSSCSYTPQQNGTVERKHRHLLEIARALMFQSYVPMRFWGDCIRTTAYLINKLPTEVLQGKCPYEVLHNKQEKVEHLRVFGCLCFASNLPGGDKFTQRERNSVLIGYSKTQKGYTLYDLDSKRVSISRDVSFREQVFPFKEGHQIIEDLFPWAESFVTHDISPEQLEQDSFSEEQATTTHDQVELVHDHIPPAPVMDSPAAADTQTTEPIETTIYSVGTSAMHQPVEQVEEQPVTDPATSQSHEEQVHTDEAVRKSSRTTRPPIWMKDYATPSTLRLILIVSQTLCPTLICQPITKHIWVCSLQQLNQRISRKPVRMKTR